MTARHDLADEFFRRIRERMEAGEREYGDRSWSRDPAELVGEVQQELEDVVGWAAILWARLDDVRRRVETDPVPLAGDESPRAALSRAVAVGKTVSVGEAAAAWGCHPRTVHRRIRSGKLLATKVSNEWHICRAAFDAWPEIISKSPNAHIDPLERPSSAVQGRPGRSGPNPAETGSAGRTGAGNGQR